MSTILCIFANNLKVHIMVKHCQACGCELTTERKWCKSCKKARKREYAKQHYKNLINQGITKVRYGKTNCVYCGKEIIKNRPDQNVCYKCYLEHHYKTVDNYNSVKRSKTGLHTIGRQIIVTLGFKLTNNMVVHHIDENPNNNNLSNLMLINRKHHGRLHSILAKNWSLLSKDNSSNLENCWNILRGQLTTAYLEMNSANVIKITDIGQSAAEPLNKDSIYIFDLQEEGSETMYQAPKSISQGEDIVQTQTENNQACENKLGM